MINMLGFFDLMQSFFQILNQHDPQEYQHHLVFFEFESIKKESHIKNDLELSSSNLT